MPVVFAALVVCIGIVNVVFPDVFLLFAFYTSAGMPAVQQILWVVLAVLCLFFVCEPGLTVRRPGLAVLVLSVALVASFFVFRIAYPSLFADGEVGGLPTDMKRPSGLSMIWADQSRLPSLICMGFFRDIPDWLRLDPPFVLLFRNFELNTANLLLGFASGILVVVLLGIAATKVGGASGVERICLWVFLACSSPMLNAYGFYDTYIHVILILSAFFVGAWLIARNPASWKGYAFSAAALPPGFVTHEYLWCTLAYLVGLGGLIFLRKKKIRVPFWLLVVCGIVAGCAPLASAYALDASLLTRVYSYRLELYLFTQAMACVFVALPALVLAVGLIAANPAIRRNPTPIQGMALVVMVANIVIFFFPIIAPSPPIMIHNYGVYAAAIYGSAALLFFSTLTGNSEAGIDVVGVAGQVAVPPAGGSGVVSRQFNLRLLGCCAVLGVFTFVPTVYVYSTRLSYERFVRIVPDDTTSRWSRDMSPYVSLALWTPVDSEEDRDARLELFRRGFSSPRPEWEEFRSLNLIYYIAWCFEFGRVQEGTTELLKVFGQPGIVRDLWANGTRFTDRYDNKAYKRIRGVSRRIIDENIRRQPDNDYLRKMSHLLEQYEKFNP